MNNRRWVQVNTSNPGAIAAGDLDASYRDEALGAFPGCCLLARYENVPPWKSFLNTAPVHLVACDLDGDGRDNVVADRGPLGILVQQGSGTWESIDGLGSRSGLQCGDLHGPYPDVLIADRSVAKQGL